MQTVKLLQNPFCFNIEIELFVLNPLCWYIHSYFCMYVCCKKGVRFFYSMRNKFSMFSNHERAVEKSEA